MNRDGFKKLLHHAFNNELRVNPEEHPVLVTDNALNPKENRETLTRIMFETFKVPAFYVAQQAVLSLYASGRTTGVVLQSGGGTTQVVPVYEGYTQPHAVIEMQNLAGTTLTNYMVKLLSEAGHTFVSRSDMEVV